MIHKGRAYRKCPRIVTLPTRDEAGNLLPHVPADKENYTFFGRAVMPDTEKEYPTAVKTNYRWGTEPDSKHVYALPIGNKGHSTTDLMFGDDGYMYLARNAAVYRSKK